MSDVRTTQPRIGDHRRERVTGSTAAIQEGDNARAALAGADGDDT
jgi:hypothetical protein